MPEHPARRRHRPRRHATATLALVVGATLLAGCDVGSPVDPPPSAARPVEDRTAPSGTTQPEPAVTDTTTSTTIAYGDHPDQVLDLHRPSVAPSGRTVVLVHGGFWREQYRRDLMDPLVPSLLAQGHLVVNLEYRRVGGAGGWPATFEDVADGVDALVDLPGVDPDRVVTVGHSAGGHLAVWLAARHRLPVGAPGADPVVRPCHAVAQAGVVVVADAVEARLGNGAVADLLGGTDPARLAVADPSSLLPLGVGVTLVHGEQDDIVPLAQSRRWVELAEAAGDEATLIARRGGHFAVIDPDDALWQDVVATVGSTC